MLVFGTVPFFVRKEVNIIKDAAKIRYEHVLSYFHIASPHTKMKGIYARIVGSRSGVCSFQGLFKIPQRGLRRHERAASGVVQR